MIENRRRRLLNSGGLEKTINDDGGLNVGLSVQSAT